MKKHSPLLVAGGIGILVLMVSLGFKNGKAKTPVAAPAPAPVVVHETSEALHQPENAKLVLVDWEANEAFFPEPQKRDGEYWVLFYSEDRNGWESKEVRSRRDGRLYAGFPASARSIAVKVSGGSRPTYSVEFDRP